MWNYYMEFPRKRIPGKSNSRPIHVLSDDELLDHQLRMIGSCPVKGEFYWQGGAYPWCKLYRLDLIKEHNIEFLLGVHPSEDTYFNYVFLQFAKRVVYIDKILFHYRQNENSVMYKWTDNNFTNAEMMLNGLEEFHRTYPKKDAERFDQVVYSRLINTFMLGLQRTFVHKDSPNTFGESLILIRKQLQHPRYQEAFMCVNLKCLNKKAKTVVFLGKKQWTLALYFV